MNTVTPHQLFARLPAGFGALFVSIAALLLPPSASASSGNGSITITIDTTKKTATTVPANFAGIFDSSNIGKGLYDSTNNPNYNDYLSLIKQMGVQHWRVDGGSDTATTNDEFFTFVNSVFSPNAPSPCVQWGLSLFNVNNLVITNNTTVNLTNAQHILSTAPDSSIIDVFSFGNESMFTQNLEKDQFIPSIRTGQSTYSKTAITPTMSYCGQDPTTGYSTGDITPTSNTPIPTWTSGTTYNQFDVVVYQGTVYQQTKNSLLGADPGTANPTVDTYLNNGNPTLVWTPAAIADPSNGLSPQTNISYNGGFRGRWKEQYDYLSLKITGATPKFSGPDAGWGVPIVSTINSNGDSAPWTLQFANDESTRVEEVTQHLYAVNGMSDMVTGSYTYVSSAFPASFQFLAGDEVIVESSSSDKVGILYRCIKAATGITPPNSTYWSPVETPWAQGPVMQGQVVTYSSGGTTGFYQCIANGTSMAAPPNDTTLWVSAQRSQYAYPGAHQLSLNATSPQRLQDWLSVYDTALPGATGAVTWPTGVPYRMSEFSPFSGPGGGVYSGLTSDGKNLINGYCTTTQENTNCFCSALVGFELFHWWAAHGAAGVDPIAGIWQINSPIFQTPYVESNGSEVALTTTATPSAPDYVAEPYAYAWPAFAVSAQPGKGGYELSVDGSGPGVKLTNPSPTNLNVTAYAVYVPPDDVYVTIFNKTYAYDQVANAQTVTASISFPNFTPKSYSTMTLDSGQTSGQACLAMTAELAQQHLAPGGTFPPAFPAMTTWSGSLPAISPFSALIVHFSDKAP